MELVLVPGLDDVYREVYLAPVKVVYNDQDYMYFECHSDEYLDPGDRVVERLVAR